MQENNKQGFLNYFLAIRDAFLTYNNGREFIEELFAENYNKKIAELEKKLGYDLNDLKMKKEDEYFNLEDIDYFKSPVGFISDTNSTTSFKIIRSNENKRYKKLNFLAKLNQVILLLQSSK